MNKLDKLRNKWNTAQQKVDDARTELANFVYPIISILENKKPTYYSIVNISLGKDTYRIETVSERDHDVWRDYIIPVWIIEAKDPLLAATNHFKTQQQEKARDDQFVIRKEIERLQGLLK